MLTIGDMAKETGVAVQTIRHYESTGLLPRSLRSSGNQRRYGQSHLESLGFIKHARELGFSIEDIRELINLERQGKKEKCKDATVIVERHLSGVKARIKALRRLEKELTRMKASCPHIDLENCHILATLHDFRHDHCLSGQHGGGALQELPKRKSSPVQS